MQSQALPEPTPTIDITHWEDASLGSKHRADHDTEETFGQRLARLRKERGLTQVELAQRLGVAQPVVSDYERGELRLHGQLIVQLTEILGVSSEELLGLKRTAKNGAVKNRRLLRRLQEIERLPRRDQQALLRTIDRFLESFRGE